MVSVDVTQRQHQAHGEGELHRRLTANLGSQRDLVLHSFKRDCLRLVRELLELGVLLDLPLGGSSLGVGEAGPRLSSN
jgi:hypothetical protein